MCSHVRESAHGIPEVVVGYPGDEIIEAVVSCPVRFWESNLDPLQGQYVRLTAEPSCPCEFAHLQHQIIYVFMNSTVSSEVWSSNID